VSPVPEYTAVIVTDVPAVPRLGVKVTWHVPAETVHVVPGLLKTPLVGLCEKVTVPPVGVMGVPASLSITVAVQVVPADTGSGLVAHETLTDDVRLTACSPVVPELFACTASPAYVALIVIAPSLLGSGL